MGRQAGLTAIELLIVTALIALGATLAVPAFGDMLRDTRRAAMLNTLAHALHMARTAAASSGRSIRVCGTRDGRVCSGELAWEPQLLQRPSVDPLGAAAPRLTRVVPLPAGRRAPTVRSNRAAIDFAPLAPAATTATITICDDRGSSAARALIISRSGRARISERSAAGAPLDCP